MTEEYPQDRREYIEVIKCAAKEWNQLQVFIDDNQQEPYATGER